LKIYFFKELLILSIIRDQNLARLFLNEYKRDVVYIYLIKLFITMIKKIYDVEIYHINKYFQVSEI
jgi:hypothetical protein